jgi:hypothetical protein
VFQLSPDWQIDYESYDWKKLDPTSPETKKMVQEYFAWEGDFDGTNTNFIGFSLNSSSSSYSRQACYHYTIGAVNKNTVYWNKIKHITSL